MPAKNRTINIKFTKWIEVLGDKKVYQISSPNAGDVYLSMQYANLSSITHSIEDFFYFIRGEKPSSEGSDPDAEVGDDVPFNKIRLFLVNYLLI